MRIDLEQLSPEWHLWRGEGLPASFSSAIMGENPFKTPLQAWEELTGRREGFKGNAASRRGQELEPEARMYFNMVQDKDMDPACYQSDDLPFMRASLDGINSAGNETLEVKCSGFKVHNEVLSSNQHPKYYKAQMQKGLLCSGASMCWYMSYNPDHETKAVIIPIERDEDYIKRLKEEELGFWNLVLSDVPPASDVKEYIHIDDPGFDVAARIYIEAKRSADIAVSIAEASKAALLEFGDDSNFKGGGLLVARIIRQGNVDWKKLRADLKISDETVEKYRKTESSYWKITEEK